MHRPHQTIEFVLLANPYNKEVHRTLVLSSSILTSEKCFLNLKMVYKGVFFTEN